MNFGIVLTIIGGMIAATLGAYGVGVQDGRGDIEQVYQEVIGVSDIVDMDGRYPNLQRAFDYPALQWLESRTHFNNYGTAIVGYDMLVSAVDDVERLMSDLRSCSGEAPSGPPVDEVMIDIAKALEEAQNDPGMDCFTHPDGAIECIRRSP